MIFFYKLVSRLNARADKSLLTDLELIEEFRSGKNADGLGILFKRYTHLVYCVCIKYFRNRDDSQDAVMQIFEKLQTDLHKYEIHNFKSWLHSVARNHCLMQLRKKKGIYHKSFDEPLIESEVVEMESRWHPGEDLEKEQMLSRMEEGIKTLKEEQRVCIELFYLSEKSYQEVSGITGYSLLQVKSFIQNGKRNLKLYLEKKHAI